MPALLRTFSVGLTVLPGDAQSLKIELNLSLQSLRQPRDIGRAKYVSRKTKHWVVLGNHGRALVKNEQYSNNRRRTKNLNMNLGSYPATIKMD